MQQRPLTEASLLAHAERQHGDAEIGSRSEREWSSSRAERIPNGQIPEHVEFVGTLPMRDTGKVPRQALRERFAAAALAHAAVANAAATGRWTPC